MAAKAHRRSPKSRRKWSPAVTHRSGALDLEKSAFRKSPHALALSLKRSAERSRPRRKSSPYRSAMSMLTFYINRAGKNLGTKDRARLKSAKTELRKVFGQ